MGERICSIEGCCNRSRRNDGLCSTHHRHAMEASADQCSADGCSRGQYVRGLCCAHYQAAVKQHGGKLPPKPRQTGGPCPEPDCGKPIVGRGLCSFHYGQLRGAGGIRVCSISGCDQGLAARGWCAKHWTRWREHGDPLYEPPETENRCPQCGGPRARNRGNELRCTPCRDRRNKSWRAANADAIVQRRAAKYQENRDAVIAKVAAYLASHPEVRTTAASNRRARKLDGVCDHGPRCVTSVIYRQIKVSQCVYCGEPATEGDHLVPLARGGKHCRENIVPACKKCNCSKGTKSADEYMRLRTA